MNEPNTKTHLLIHKQEGDTIRIDATCCGCRETTAFILSAKGVEDWSAGKCIQYALPSLSADDRELLISGACGKCWNWNDL